MLHLALLLACGAGVLGSPVKFEKSVRKFPEGFKWAFATSAYQVEGAWNKDGRTPSIWDTFSQDPSKINDPVSKDKTGNDACRNYDLYKEDIQLMKEVGVTGYRFSISWNRLIPAPGVVNEKGVKHYSDMIDELLANDIEPMITLYHWDLPQYLQDLNGGWEAPSIVDRFVEFADLCFKSWGDRVKTWITINEPWIVAGLGYGHGPFAPGLKHRQTGVYRVGHHQLLAHARSSQLYQTKYKKLSPNGEGQIAITLNTDYSQAASHSEEDKAASQRANEFNIGWFADPIYFGKYPDSMREYIGDRLPEFTEEEVAMLKGSNMFFGLNSYCANLVAHIPDDHPTKNKTGFGDDVQVLTSKGADWLVGGASWLTKNPKGLESLLKWIADRYGNPGILITENGWSIANDFEGTLRDTERIDFLKAYLNGVLNAIESGVDVIGYTAWSAMDNFEWADGYSVRFGYIRVEFDEYEKTRELKDSAHYLSEVIKQNAVEVAEVPDLI